MRWSVSQPSPSLSEAQLKIYIIKTQKYIVSFSKRLRNFTTQLGAVVFSIKCYSTRSKHIQCSNEHCMWD